MLAAVFLCPHCSTALRPLHQRSLCIFGCPRCRGRLATVSALRRVSARAFVNALWARAREVGEDGDRTCPGCERPMRAAAFEFEAHHVALDACLRCQFVWFDAGELELAPRIPPDAALARDPDLSPVARQALAKFHVQLESERARDLGASDGPSAGWKSLAMLVDLPVREDDEPLASQAWLSWLLALLCVGVSCFVWFAVEKDGGEAIALALPGDNSVPGLRWLGAGQLLIATLASFFAHANAFHLLVSAYFLVVFGASVEELLGRAHYALLLGASAFVGLVAYTVFETHPELTQIGASGGLAGVLVWYALTFPRVRVGWWRSWRFGTDDRWFSFPLWAWLGVWVATSLLRAFELDSDPTFAAQLGGACVGALAWIGPRVLGPRSTRSIS